jgi:exodeoxyribonuclease VII small subunit
MKKQLNKNTPPLTYAAAYAELQHIVQQMQADEVDVDDLLVLTARANELIAWCRERLRQVETSLTDHPSTE